MVTDYLCNTIMILKGFDNIKLSAIFLSHALGNFGVKTDTNVVIGT